MEIIALICCLTLQPHLDTKLDVISPHLLVVEKFILEYNCKKLI